MITLINFNPADRNCFIDSPRSIQVIRERGIA